MPLPCQSGRQRYYYVLRLSVHPSVCPSVHLSRLLPNLWIRFFWKREPILKQIGTSGLWVNYMKRSTVGFRRSKIKLTWIRNRSQKSVPKSRTIEQILTKPGRHMLWQIALVSQQPACKMSKLNVTRGQSYIWRPGGGIIRDPVGSYSFYIFCIMIICAVILVCHICWLMKPRFS